ncbi:REP-associated tyrosine transposase [Thermodesulfobacteriota bacterium B35]
MSRSRYTFGEPDQPHFLTCTVVEWLPVFTRPEAAEIIFDTWRFLQQRQGLQIFGYVLLENHLHAVTRAGNLPAIWRNFKSYSARQLISMLTGRAVVVFLKRMRFSRRAFREDRQYQFWQEGSHPQAISGEEMLRQKLEYIHLNPVKRGYVDRPEHWRWSSARNYAGMEGCIEVVTSW